MATDESNIPIISITTTDDRNQGEINRVRYQHSPEPLTDLEDIDCDTIQPVLGRLNIDVEDDNALTDGEVVEASDYDDDDDDKDTVYKTKTPVNIDHIIDYGGNYDELIRITSSSSMHQKQDIASRVTASKSSESGYLLNTFYEKDGTTDYEDFYMSDEEDNGEEDINEGQDDDILNKMLDDETIDIADRVRNSPIPSPVTTPDIRDRKQKRGKNSRKPTVARRKKTNENFLYPKSPSPHLSDFTDTEIVLSDSDEDSIKKERPLSPQERRKKQIKEVIMNKNKQKIVKVPNDASLSLESEISSVHIIEKVPVNEVVSESDTENIHNMPRKYVLHAPKKKTLLMEVAGALMKETFASTDIEHFEGSNESDEDSTSQISEQNFRSIDSQCGFVKDKQTTKNRLQLPKQDRVVLTDTEDVETEDEVPSGVLTNEIELKGESTEEDDFEATDTEYLAAVKELRARAWKESNYEIRFIAIDGQARPLAITPDLPNDTTSSTLRLPAQAQIYTTDTEELDGDSDLDIPKSILSIPSSEHDLGLTDVETFDTEDEVIRPKSPEPSDDENSQALPEPTREMILVKEDSIGRPVSVVLPLGNVEPNGLTAPSTELEGGISEVEDMMTEDDEALPVISNIHSVTHDFPEIDSSVIHTCEVIKVQKKKLKVLGDGPSEPVTDTEDLFLSVSGKRKRAKTKLRLGLDPKHDKFNQDLTDTEDIVFSDAENHRKLLTPQVETDPTTDIDDLDLSGEEETQDFQRSLAVTPEYFKELGDSYTTLKEGIGPFTDEARQNVLSLNSIPIINTISPSPDIPFIMNTDTEDMATSADEDGFSRAETVTPYDTGIELEDHSSVVYMKHTRKFDLDAPEEAIHVKGAIESHDTHTDIEDLGISEDENSKPLEQLFVNDTVNEVCVCLNSEIEGEDSVCVCVNKNHGGLSLVWNSKTSTDTNQQRGIHSVLLTSCKRINHLPSYLVASREEYVPVNPCNLDSSKVPSVICKTKTSFSSNPYKYLLIEDNDSFNYFSFYLYLESVEKPHIVKVVYKFSITLTSLGFATKLVICQRNIYRTSVASLIVYLFKTIPLDTESNEINCLYINVPAHIPLKSLPIIREMTRKVKKKVQNRAWSGSDILEKKSEDLVESKLKSVSVSKLISCFESLSSPNETDHSNISCKEQDLEVTKNEEHYFDKIFCNDSICSTNELTAMDDMQLNNENFLSRDLTIPVPKNTFKPIIPIIPLKDRSVSPRRLDPAPIRDSPAFKALFGRTKDESETLTQPFSTLRTKHPSSFLITSYKMNKKFNIFPLSSSSSSENQLKENNELTMKIQAFEIMAGSPRLRRKLTLKRNSETEMISNLQNMPSNISTSCSEIFYVSKSLSLAQESICSNTSPDSAVGVKVKQYSSIRRASSCPISQWVRTDWAEKGKPDSTVDSSNIEGDEALLDLATGLQDTKGSVTGPAPSGTK